MIVGWGVGGWKVEGGEEQIHVCSTYSTYIQGRGGGRVGETGFGVGEPNGTWISPKAWGFVSRSILVLLSNVRTPLAGTHKVGLGVLVAGFLVGTFGRSNLGT